MWKTNFEYVDNLSLLIIQKKSKIIQYNMKKIIDWSWKNYNDKQNKRNVKIYYKEIKKRI